MFQLYYNLKKHFTLFIFILCGCSSSPSIKNKVSSEYEALIQESENKVKGMCFSNNATACFELGNYKYNSDRFQEALYFYERSCKLKDNDSCNSFYESKSKFLLEECINDNYKSCLEITKIQSDLDFVKESKLTAEKSILSFNIGFCDKGKIKSCFKVFNDDNLATLEDKYFAYKIICKKDNKFCQKHQYTFSEQIQNEKEALELEKKQAEIDLLVNSCENNEISKCIKLANLIKSEDESRYWELLSKSCDLGDVASCKKNGSHSIKEGETQEAIKSYSKLCELDVPGSCEMLISLRKFDEQQQYNNYLKQQYEQQLEEQRIAKQRNAERRAMEAANKIMRGALGVREKKGSIKCKTTRGFMGLTTECDEY